MKMVNKAGRIILYVALVILIVLFVVMLATGAVMYQP